MDMFFDNLLRPMLAACQARVLVEVGADKGALTSKLATYCAGVDGIVHVVDPTPRFPVDKWRELYEGRLIVHRALSLDVLADLEPADAIFIDGDHNWYTVFNELRMLEAARERDGMPLPLIALHDVGWPYGRRDLYYAPETVPQQFRQPHAERGMVPGVPHLTDEGMNGGLHNAESEGGPHNGVMTAVEDFLEQSDTEWRTLHLPAFHGLFVMVDARRAAEHPELARAMAELRPPPEIAALMEKLEASRVQWRTRALRIERARG